MSHQLEQSIRSGRDLPGIGFENCLQLLAEGCPCVGQRALPGLALEKRKGGPVPNWKAGSFQAIAFDEEVMLAIGQEVDGKRDEGTRNPCNLQQVLRVGISGFTRSAP